MSIDGLPATCAGSRTKINYLIIKTNYYKASYLVTIVSTIKHLLSLLNFFHPDIMVPKSAIRNWLDAAAPASISTSQRIFLARNCKEWFTNLYILKIAIEKCKLN